MQEKRKLSNITIYVVLTVLAVIFIVPIALVLMNSLKNKLYISTTPFELPNAESFRGLKNYTEGLTKIHFFDSIGYSLFITVVSVILIIVFCSMIAWFIVRVKNKITSAIYFMFIASMVVPFQMVMFTMTSLSDKFHLRNPIGMCILYLGFDAGLSVFMFAGFVKSIPLEIEEAAMIDGCTPLQTFFGVVFPILKPTAITVAILDAMHVWNDFLLPYLVIGISTKYKTIPVVVQMLVGSNGNKNMGALMAMLVLSIIPIIIFYLTFQKYIIEDVVADAI